MERAQNAMMSQNRQGKALRMGGVAAIILFLYFFVFSGTTTSSISSIAGGKNVYSSANSPTTKCTRPHDATKPLVQYAVMIDAGSTGSRIHVYKFNNCGSTPELENEEFKMTEKREGGSGLSSYKTDAEGAAMSLDPLLKVAMDTVPDDYKSCSPIAVKATAGLRLLGDEMSAKILEAVRHRLETAYPFPVVSAEKGGVEIMPGEMEGVYAWITTNYLLGKIGGPDKSPTAAIFDLGGGSTQIVFQPTFPEFPGGGMPSVSQMEEGDHKYSLNFGGRSFELYQHSHLGYGLMSARKALHTLVLENAANQNPTSLSFLSEPIPNPLHRPQHLPPRRPHLPLHPLLASNNGNDAPRHQPSSFPAIFFAIFTSRSIGSSYPVCSRANIKFKSRHHSGRSSNSLMAALSNVDSHVALPEHTLCVRSWSSRTVKLSGMPRSLVRS